ncbi:MAG: hypothetical protein WKF75_01645 [Singulisphaera sp.]
MPLPADAVAQRGERILAIDAEQGLLRAWWRDGVAGDDVDDGQLGLVGRALEQDQPARHPRRDLAQVQLDRGAELATGRAMGMHEAPSGRHDEIIQLEIEPASWRDIEEVAARAEQAIAQADRGGERIAARASPVRLVLARAEHHGGRVRLVSFDRHGAVRQAQVGPRPDRERRPSSFPGRIRPGQDDVDPFQLERTRPEFEPDRRRGWLFGIGRSRLEANPRAGLPGLRADAPAAFAPKLGAREDPIGVRRHEQALAARGRPAEGVPEFLGGM